MKNNITNLNTIYAFTNETLINSNIINVKIPSSDQIATFKLSSSRLKLFLKYYKSLCNNKKLTNLIETPNRSIVLDDIKNFRKYFNNYSFSLDLEQIKQIFIFNNITLDELYRFIDSSDYFWIRDLNESMLSKGILTKRNWYHNILIDLKLESIPKEIIYNYPISLLFKFLINKEGNIQDISNKKDFSFLKIKYKFQIEELINKDYISLYYDIWEGDPDPILDSYLDDDSEYSLYNGYCGNYETYYTFQWLLQIYLDGINLYKYKGKYYSYKQFKKVYDIKSIEHSRFINDNMLEYHINIDKAYEDLFKHNKEIITLTCKCVEVSHKVASNNIITDSLSNLIITFKPFNKEIKINKEIKMYLSDFL